MTQPIISPLDFTVFIGCAAACLLSCVFNFYILGSFKKGLKEWNSIMADRDKLSQSISKGMIEGYEGNKGNKGNEGSAPDNQTSD